jgi:predicted acyltransferase
MNSKELRLPADRLLSLDVMRGLIMVLLMLESCRLYDQLEEVTTGTIFSSIIVQFFHHPWHGLRLWDLVQPAFMFMAGTALAYSLHHQQQKGWTWGQSFIKTLKRSWWLFFWGVLDYAVRPGGLSFELWDVLTQLSFTTLIAFLIFRWTAAAQVGFSIALLILTEVLYRFTNVPGFDQPFTDQHNFGNYMDLILMNKINKGGWVAINCIPTAAHTIWGALAGKLLLSGRPGLEKIKVLVIAGAVSLLAGMALDWTFTPIIKRIATSSFVLASAAHVFWTLALLYWWIDLKGHKNGWTFFTVVGMNSLFIYLFIEIVGGRWFTGYITAIAGGALEIIHMPLSLIGIIAALAVFGAEWGICWFLYKKRIFFKI